MGKNEGGRKGGISGDSQSSESALKTTTTTTSGHTACEILVPQTGDRTHALRWKHGVLTTGPPGKSQNQHFFKKLFK